MLHFQKNFKNKRKFFFLGYLRGYVIRFGLTLLHFLCPFFNTLISFYKGATTKKERRQAHLQAKKHSDVVPGLLADWEILRRDSTETSKKHELVEKMISVSKVSVLAWLLPSIYGFLIVVSFRQN